MTTTEIIAIPDKNAAPALLWRSLLQSHVQWQQYTATADATVSFEEDEDFYDVLSNRTCPIRAG